MAINQGINPRDALNQCMVDLGFSNLKINLDGTYTMFSDVGVTTPPDLIERRYSDFLDSLTKPVSPLILDLDGNGISLTSLNGAGPVYFDIDNDGQREATAWVKPGDGFLVYDANNNGKIDGQFEMFGAPVGADVTDPTANGFAPLEAFDSDGNRIINSADARFGEIKVWQDSNQDGIAQPDELFTLAQLEITSIKLDATQVNYSIEGNQITYESTFTYADGRTQKIADVWFNYDNVNSVYAGEYTLNPEVLFLPDLRGYGALPELAIAMSLKPELLHAVEEFSDMDLFAPVADVMQRLTQIMHLWADMENTDVGLRGAGINARDIGFLEKLFDKSATPDLNGYIGYSGRGQELESIFYDVRNLLLARLLLQGNGQQFFVHAPDYDPTTDTFTGKPEFDFDFLSQMTNGESSDAYFKWSLLLKTVEYSVGLNSLDEGTRDHLDQLIRHSDPSGMLNFDTIAQDVNINYGMFGTAENDELASTSNEGLHFFGLAGNDRIISDAVAGNDIMNAGKGNDYLSTNGGTDKLYGEEGNDTLFTTNYDKALYDGGQGTDTLIAHHVDISKATLSGIEILQVNFQASMTAEQMASFESITTGQDAGEANIVGTDGGTYSLEGKEVDGVINITGSKYDDTIIGNDAGQMLLGGDGNDTIHGGGGNDAIYDDVGQNEIHGDGGNDNIVCQANGDPIRNLIVGGEGYDTVDAYLANLALSTFMSVEELVVHSSVILNGGQLADFETLTMVGGEGVIQAAAGGNYDLSGLSVSGRADLRGSDGDDVLTGNGAGQYIEGNEGDDVIDGKAGDDHLWDNSGHNTIHGGDGNDVISGRGQRDILAGDAGDDEIGIDQTAGSEVDGGDGRDRLIFSGDDLTSLKVASIEILRIGPTLKLTADQFRSVDTIENYYQDSNPIDLHAGSVGAFSLAGTATTSVINFFGAAGAQQFLGNDYSQTLFGEGGKDILQGKGGNDTLSGGIGNDRLDGGRGNDTIMDGRGNDTTVFRRGDGDDTLAITTGRADHGDVLSFLKIKHTSLTFTHVANDLVIGVTGTDDTVTIEDWYSGKDHHLDSILTAGGYTIHEKDIGRLTAAMDHASFAEPQRPEDDLYQVIDADQFWFN
jgi:Ca2+-binding RTX toxin-like protein